MGLSFTPDAPAAPCDWAYHLFPLERAGSEELFLDRVAAEGLRRLAVSQATGDRTLLGTTLHWAHILKARQDPDGAWPLLVNARTGNPKGSERTRRPADFLAALGDALESSEFDAAVALARHCTDEGDTHE